VSFAAVQAACTSTISLDCGGLVAIAEIMRREKGNIIPILPQTIGVRPKTAQPERFFAEAHHPHAGLLRPIGVAFLQKGADSLGCVAVEHVLYHQIASVLICLFNRHFELLVE